MAQPAGGETAQLQLSAEQAALLRAGYFRSEIATVKHARRLRDVLSLAIEEGSAAVPTELTSPIRTLATLVMDAEAGYESGLLHSRQDRQLQARLASPQGSTNLYDQLQPLVVPEVSDAA